MTISSPSLASSAMFFSQTELFSSFIIALHYEKLISEARISRHFMISGRYKFILKKVNVINFRL